MSKAASLRRRYLAHAATALVVSLTLVACATPGIGADRNAADALPETNALGSYLAGRHAQQKRDYTAAATFYARALAADPDDFDLMNRTLVLEVSEGRIAPSMPLAERVAAIDENSPIVNLLLTVDRAKAGDFAAADARAAELPEDGVHRFATPLVRGWVKLGMGDKDAAIAALQSLGETRGLAPLKDFHAAIIADLAGSDEEAARLYESVLKAATRLNWRSVEMVGNFYERHGRGADAAELYRRFMAESRESDLAQPALDRVAAGKVPKRRVATPAQGIGEALFDLAAVLNQGETIDLALIYARLALYLEPDLVQAKLLIADLLDQQHRPAPALALNRSIDRGSPFAWAARLRAAAELDALGRTEEALAELKEMAAERPDRAQPLVQLGDLLRTKSRFGEAVAAYDEAMQRLPEEARQWGLYYSRGVALERAGLWPRAEVDLQKALELQPDQPYVLNYLGYSWVDKGERLDEAFKMIERAVELRPNDGYIVDSLGWAHYRRGDYATATTYLERAVELRPQDPTINDHLGDVYWRVGRYNEARAQWQRALQFGPDAKDIPAIEAKLDRGLETPGAAPSPPRGG